MCLANLFLFLIQYFKYFNINNALKYIKIEIFFDVKIKIK